MKCPVCNIDLLMSERKGIEIDYCPKCRGIWLDRGELDKMIERSAQTMQEPASQVDRRPVREPAPQHDPRGDYEHTSMPGHQGHPPRRKKRESFLEELFDF